MKKWFLGILFALLAVSLFAGTIGVADEEGVLSVADKNTLMLAAQSVPFEVQVITTSTHPDLESYVAGFVTEPRQVAIGLDTIHRKCRIKIGRGLIAGFGALDASAKRGNGAFKQGRWGDGLATVIQAVSESVTPPPVQVAAERVVTHAQEQAPSGLPWWVVIVGTLGIGGTIWWIIRSKKKAEKKREEQEYAALRASPPLPRSAKLWATTPPSSVTSSPPPIATVYSPTPVIVNSPAPASSGPNLVDYMILDRVLHRYDSPAPAPPYTPPAPVPVHYDPPAPSSPSPSYDSGGSSWSSSDSGGSSFDGGSSGGSDF
jgi:uncharacterized membrane protein YgcG